MFISGVPGTGKTATVQCVMRDLLKDEQLKSFKNKVKMMEINGLKLSDPNNFYSHFHYVSIFDSVYSTSAYLTKFLN